MTTEIKAAAVTLWRQKWRHEGNGLIMVLKHMHTVETFAIVFGMQWKHVWAYWIAR